MLSLWRRVPLFIRAVVLGLLVGALGTLPWAGLAAANLKLSPGVPWAVPVMAVYLWLFWRYFGGAGWPRSTAPARQEGRRFRPLRGDVLGTAFLAGMLGLWALVVAMRVVNRLVHLPSVESSASAQLPLLTLVLALPMGALVAGVVEETAFRGYMQGPLERRYGPALAIVVTSAIFAAVHLTHHEVTLIILPYLAAAGAVYGTLAYLTDSILPGLVVHVAGDLFAFLMQLASGGRVSWANPAQPAPLIWERGPDAAFWLTCAGALAVGAAAVLAFRELGRVARSAPGSELEEEVARAMAG